MVARYGAAPEVTVIVDPLTAELVEGSTLDAVEHLGGVAFRISNPNARRTCGCGQPFN